jgi:hypothetical protein
MSEVQIQLRGFVWASSGIYTNRSQRACATLQVTTILGIQPSLVDEAL